MCDTGIKSEITLSFLTYSSVIILRVSYGHSCGLRNCLKSSQKEVLNSHQKEKLFFFFGDGGRGGLGDREREIEHASKGGGRGRGGES